MNRLQFGDGACDKTGRYLDSYISNELLVETNHEVLRHIESCSVCAAELDVRSRLRARLKAAVQAQAVPPEVSVRVRERLRSRSRTWFLPGWGSWAVAMAVSLALFTGFWWNFGRARMPGLSDRPGQNAYIERVSASLAAVLRVGLGDHIHCSIFRKYPRNPPPVERMEEELGPAYQGILPVVRAAVPEGYRIIMAHQCGYGGRRFVHVTLEKNGGLLSLVIARKEAGDSLAGLSPEARVSGIAVYQGDAQPYQVAGFEAGDFLAYVVSDLHQKANLEVAVNLAPGVREFLTKAPA